MDSLEATDYKNKGFDQTQEKKLKVNFEGDSRNVIFVAGLIKQS